MSCSLSSIVGANLVFTHVPVQVRWANTRLVLCHTIILG